MHQGMKSLSGIAQEKLDRTFSKGVSKTAHPSEAKRMATKPNENRASLRVNNPRLKKYVELTL